MSNALTVKATPQFAGAKGFAPAQMDSRASHVRVSYLRAETSGISARRGLIKPVISISGLHITMLAALAAALAHRAWVRVPALVLRLPARKAAAVAGLAAALAYSLLTGYAVPAQRTFFMLATVAACLLAERHGSPSRVLALAAIVVCALDPWAVLAPGFWLSFGAVASIFHALSLRTGEAGGVRSAVGEQLAVTVLMLPMLLALFQ